MDKSDIADLLAEWQALERPNLFTLERISADGLTEPTIPPASVEYFGQCAEDAIIDSLIKASLGRDYDYSNMRYVDIGANHPVSTSNTWLFHQRGAKGVLVEANPDLVPELISKRPHDRVVAGAARASDQGETVPLYLASKHEVSSTVRPFLDAMVAQKGGEEKGWAFRDEVTVPVVDINSLIEETILDGDFVLLTVDTEGADLDVLRHIDINKYRPRFIIIEPSDEIIGSDAGSGAIDEFLSKNGYRCIARTRVNLIYRHVSDGPMRGVPSAPRSYSFGDQKAHITSPPEFRSDTDRFERTVAAIESERTKVVSFDVFDTAIVRPVLEPKDLFLLLNRQMRDETGIVNLDFATQRAKAESDIRRWIIDKEEKRDPSLDEIYEVLSRRLKIAPDAIAKMKDTEVEAEIGLTYRNEAVFRLYNEAISAGKRVVFCSDTYFSHSVIERMLQRAGYADYERIFVSSELGCTKKDGELFDFVSQQLGVSPSDITHFGDNRKSDVERAKERGIHPLLLKSPRDKFMASGGQHRSFWLNFNRLDLPTRCFHALYANKFYSDSIENSDPDSLFDGSVRRFGYYALGPLLYGLVAWMRQEATARGIDQVFFLSRDGYLPLRAWEELDLSSKGGPRASYLHISRRAALSLGLIYGDPVPTVFSTPASSSFTVRDFFRSRFGENPGDILIKKYEQDGLDPLAVANSVESEISLFLSTNRALVEELSKGPAEAALKYYLSQTSRSSSPAIFDVGRKGTFQNLLSRILGKNFFGLYVITEGAIADNATANDYASLFPQVARHLFPDEPDTVIYESLFSDVAPSVIGWNDDLTPIFDERTRSDELSAQAIGEIQEGALEFIRDVKASFGDSFLTYRFNPRVLNRALTGFWESSSDAAILDAIQHEDSLFHNVRRGLSSYYDNKRVQSGGKFSKLSNSNLKHLVFYCPAMTRIKGGVERVVSLLTFYLARRGYQITILTSGDVGQQITKAVYPLAENTAVLHTNVRDENYIRRQLEALRPDGLIVLASGELVAVFAKLARSMKIPIMLGERAEPSASRDTYWRPEKRHRYLTVYNKADVVSVQLPSFRRFFPALMRRKVIVLPNPVPSLEVAAFETRKKIISCVARIYLDQKKQDLLVRAFALIAQSNPDWVVHLYGTEREEDGETLRHLISQLGLSERVVLKGSTADMQSVYDASSIFAFPSVFEGFPNALAEALSAGIPAVGLKRCAGTNELIVDRRNGFLVGGAGENDEIRGFADALQKLISDEKLRRQLGRNATESMARYRPESALSDWASGIELMLRRGRRRALIAPALASVYDAITLNRHRKKKK